VITLEIMRTDYTGVLSPIVVAGRQLLGDGPGGEQLPRTINVGGDTEL
jgi:hypothetical protein